MAAPCLTLPPIENRYPWKKLPVAIAKGIELVLQIDTMLFRTYFSFAVHDSAGQLQRTGGGDRTAIAVSTPYLKIFHVSHV